MGTLKDLTGQRFGRLVVLRRAAENDRRGKATWEVACDCGTIKAARGEDIASGDTKSCGCLKREMLASGAPNMRHGMRRTKVWRAWVGMRNRCKDQKHPGWRLYGGRGIRVSMRWQVFENFYADMSDPPSPKHSIDRINNDGPYSRVNCRWATASEQARNRRRKDHCKHGHPLWGENVYWRPNGERSCRACMARWLLENPEKVREYKRQYASRMRASQRPTPGTHGEMIDDREGR